MGSGYEISVQDVLRVVAELEGLLSDFHGSTQDASRVVVPGSSYGQVGSAAASSSTAVQNQLMMTLQALAQTLTTINQRVKASAEGYAGSDHQIAGVLAQMTAAEKATFAATRRLRPPTT